MAKISVSNIGSGIKNDTECHRQLSAHITKASALAHIVFDYHILELDESDPAFGFIWTLVDLVLEIERVFVQLYPVRTC